MPVPKTKPSECRQCRKVLPVGTVGRVCAKCLDATPMAKAVCVDCGAQIEMPKRLTISTGGCPVKPRCDACKSAAMAARYKVDQATGVVTSPVERELASRMLARKYLIPYIQRHDGSYRAGWVHRDIALRLERFVREVEAGRSPRLILSMPPRSGKSRLVSQEFISWALGAHPEWEFIATSYSLSLPVEFSRAIRDRLREPSYQVTFPHTALSPDSQSVESWKTTRSGGFLAAGVGGAITGRGAHCLLVDDPCVAEGETVLTGRGGIPIEQVRVGDLVWTHRNRWRPVTATYDNGVKGVVEVATGVSRVRVTPEHLVYTRGGWKSAEDAADVYTNAYLPGVRPGAGRPMPNAPYPVSQVEGRGFARVFDITVAEDHSFVAGGTVVHNCKNEEEAESVNIRNSVFSWFTSTAYTRLAPGGGILIIQTRWHVDDLSGRLEQAAKTEDGEHWEIVKYPAIAVEDEEHRMQGEALHPERYDVDALRRIQRAVGSRTWNALYQQNPVPDTGAFFEQSMIRLYDSPPALLDVYNTWDLAIGKSQRNDYTVGMRWGISPEGDVYVLSLIRERMDSFAIVEAMLDLWVLDARTRECGIEGGVLKHAIGPYLEQRAAERRLFAFHATPLKPGRSDKEARARVAQGMMREGRVHFPREAPWREALELELLQFPFGAHDDMVDTLAYACRTAADSSPPTVDGSSAVDVTKRWLHKLLRKGRRDGGKDWRET